MGFHVFHRDEPSLYAPFISSDARLIVWPGVGAQQANMNYVRMQPGERNHPHSHAASEDTIFILDGRGTVDDLTNGTRQPFETGDVIHVPIGVRHAVCADRGEAVVSMGGPCPADWGMLRMLGVEPDQ
jgi:quercetin dioxygenase-like cupin family protein